MRKNMSDATTVRSYYLSDDLRTATHEAAETGYGHQVHFALTYNQPLYADDIKSVPQDAEAVKIDNETRNIEQLPDVQTLEVAFVSDPTDQIMSALGDTKIRTLLIQSAKKIDFEIIARCISLEHLIVRNSPSLKSLGFLANLSRLRTVI